jgi:hypothetical protein
LPDRLSPVLLVRARVKPEVRRRFRAWYRDVHLRDVRRIPGITTVQWGETAAGTHLGMYTFESSEVVQAALASPQAAYARGTWDQWAGNLDELLVELFAPLLPMPMFNSPN